MKKPTSQIFVAIVCGLLGFLLSYQFKSLTLSKMAQEANTNSPEVISEIERLTQKNDELTKANEALSENLKKIEETVKEDGNVSKEITSQLEAARMQIGLETVKGPGIEITITPKTAIFGNNTTSSSKSLSEDELVYLTNILWFGRAEAVSINNYRITVQTGIKNSGNYVTIGSLSKVDPNEKIVIKAIGDKTKLKTGLEMQELKKYRYLVNYDINIEEKEELVIEKTNHFVNNEYMRPVKE